MKKRKMRLTERRFILAHEILHAYLGYLLDERLALWFWEV